MARPKTISFAGINVIWIISRSVIAVADHQRTAALVELVGELPADTDARALAAFY
jgi:hypothetical protein